MHARFRVAGCCVLRNYFVCKRKPRVAPAAKQNAGLTSIERWLNRLDCHVLRRLFGPALRVTLLYVTPRCACWLLAAVCL